MEAYKDEKGETQTRYNSDLGTLTILKPHGFGAIRNLNGLNATQFFKTSTAPLFPSEIDDNNPILVDMLMMMEKQQGMLAFASSMKGEVLYKQSLSQPQGGYKSQALAYADFGNQLDISD